MIKAAYYEWCGGGEMLPYGHVCGEQRKADLRLLKRGGVGQVIRTGKRRSETQRVVPKPVRIPSPPDPPPIPVEDFVAALIEEWYAVTGIRPVIETAPEGALQKVTVRSDGDTVVARVQTLSLGMARVTAQHLFACVVRDRRALRHSRRAQ